MKKDVNEKIIKNLFIWHHLLSPHRYAEGDCRFA
jgi:hypothetical protein